MRDRLIELLDGFPIKCFVHCDGALKGNCGICHRKQLADYLISNGVIVPTFSCGDRVYFTPKGFNEVCEATVIVVEYNYYTSPQEWITIEYTSSAIGTHEYKSRVDLMLNEVLFLTKEEAEKALRGEGE